MNAASSDGSGPFQDLGRIAADQPAVMQQPDAVGALGFVQVRRGHEDGDAVLQQLIQDRPEIAAGNRIDAVGRLVQKQNLRPVQQRAHQRQLLLHAARRACPPGARGNGSMRVIRSRPGISSARVPASMPNRSA